MEVERLVWVSCPIVRNSQGSGLGGSEEKIGGWEGETWPGGTGDGRRVWKHLIDTASCDLFPPYFLIFLSSFHSSRVIAEASSRLIPLWNGLRYPGGRE